MRKLAKLTPLLQDHPQDVSRANGQGGDIQAGGVFYAALHDAPLAMQRLRDAAGYVANMFRAGGDGDAGGGMRRAPVIAQGVTPQEAELAYVTRRRALEHGLSVEQTRRLVDATQAAQQQGYLASIGFGNEDLSDAKLIELERELRSSILRWREELGARYRLANPRMPREQFQPRHEPLDGPLPRSARNPTASVPPHYTVYLPGTIGGSPPRERDALTREEMEQLPLGEEPPDTWRRIKEGLAHVDHSPVGRLPHEPLTPEEEKETPPPPPRAASPPGVRIKPSAKSKTTSAEIKLVPSVFRGANQEGDFKWMINRPEWQDALFVFNDNEAQFEAFRAGKEGGFTTGGGNAAIRPYRRMKPPRSAGIPTGPLPGGAGATDGYTSLSVHNKRVIDTAIGVIRELLASGKYKRVVYSAKDEATGELGSGIFNVAPEVKRYIVERLRETVAQANREAGKKLDERLAEKARGGKPAAPAPEAPAPKQKKPAARKKPAAAAGPAKVTFAEFLEAVERAYKNEDRTRWREYAELANAKSDEEWLAWLDTFVSDVQEGPRSAENLRRRIVEIHARDLASAYQKAINEVENTPLPPPDAEEETEPIQRFPPPPSSEKPPRESPARVVTPNPAPAPPQPAPAPAPPQPPPAVITSLNDVIMRDQLPPSRERLEEEEAERKERARLEKNARRAARRREERAKKKEKEKEDYVDALSALISLQENPSKRGRGSGSVAGELVPYKRPRTEEVAPFDPYTQLQRLRGMPGEVADTESGATQEFVPPGARQWFTTEQTVRREIHERALAVSQLALKVDFSDPESVPEQLYTLLLSGNEREADLQLPLGERVLRVLRRLGYGTYDARGRPLKSRVDLAQYIYNFMSNSIGAEIAELYRKAYGSGANISGQEPSLPALKDTQPSDADLRRMLRDSEDILADPATPPLDSDAFRNRYKLVWVGGPDSWTDPRTGAPFPYNTAIVTRVNQTALIRTPAQFNFWRAPGRDRYNEARSLRFVRESDEMHPIDPLTPPAPFVPPLHLRVPPPRVSPRRRVNELPVVEDTSRTLVPYAAPSAHPRTGPATTPGSPPLSESIALVRARIASAMEESRRGMAEGAEREAARRLRVYQERILAGDGSGASTPPTRLELAIWEKLAEKVRAEAFLTEESFDSDAPGYSRAVQSALLARITLRIQSLEEDIKGAEAAAAAPPRPPHTATDEPAGGSSSSPAPPPLPPLFEHHPEDLVAEFGAEEAPPFVEAPPGPAPEALPLPEELGLGVAPAPPPVLPVVEASGPPEVAWLGGGDDGYVSIRSANEDDRRIFSNGEEEDSPDYEQTRLEAGITYLLGDNIEELKRRILRDDSGGEPRTFVVLTREDYPEEYRVLSHRKMLWERDHAATEEVEEEPVTLPPPELPPPLLVFEPEVLDELAPRIRILSTVPHARRVRTDVDPATLYPMPILSDAEARGIVGGVRRSARLAAKRERMARMAEERRAAEREAPPAAAPPRKRARKSRK